MIQFLTILIGARYEKAQQAETRGATAVEYGLLVALIAAIIVGVVFTLGGKISSAFNKVNSSLSS